MTGAQLTGAVDLNQTRRGLLFWFENYNRDDGPVFSIHPAGLKRHNISLFFGQYSDTCITHIKARASDYDFSVARNLLDKVSENFTVKIDGKDYYPDWTIDTNFKMSVTRTVAEPKSKSEMLKSVELIMAPLVCAVAELIGYESNELTDNDINEGAISYQISTRYERNPRNRMLCLALHGDKCFICGFSTESKYKNLKKSIIEVHHILPLSELENPRRYNPKKDLVPLCPNCHSAIHSDNPALTPEQLKSMLRKAQE